MPVAKIMVAVAMILVAMVSREAGATARRKEEAA